MASPQRIPPGETELTEFNSAASSDEGAGDSAAEEVAINFKITVAF